MKNTLIIITVSAKLNTEKNVFLIMNAVKAANSRPVAIIALNSV